MKKKVLLAIGAMFVFGLAVVAFAYTNRSAASAQASGRSDRSRARL